jgi:ABC-type bacteriocin/lantibiotic exporter with double-glycine peptidase domain
MHFREYATNTKLILSFLELSDRKKLVLLTLSNLFLAFLDLLGVAALGVLTAMAIQGAQALEPGDRVSWVLEILQISELDFRTRLIVLSVGAVLIFVLKTFLSALITRKTLYFLGYRSAYVGSKLVDQLLKQQVSYIRAKSPQELTYAVNSGASYSVLGVLGSISKFVSDLVLMAVLAVGLLVVDWVTALTTFCIFSITGILLTKFLHKKARNLGTVYSDKTIMGNQSTLNAINAHSEISVRGTSEYFSSIVSKQKFDLSRVESESAFLAMVSKYVFEIMVIFCSFVICAVQLTMNSPARGAAIIAVFLGSISRAAPAALRAQQTVTQIQNYFAKITPTLELMTVLKAQRILPSNSKETFDHTEFVPAVEFSDMSFSYKAGSSFSIKNLTLEINPGEFVAILGPSGSGKSTLVDLILGAQTPDSGEVKISHLHPREAILKFPGAVGYVPQDISILPDTIRRNIDLGYGRSEGNDYRYLQVLNQAKLNNVVDKLPRKLDEVLGEAGYGLSGGQKQRLGIARALFTNPKLMILDEATNALDIETEYALAESLQEIRENKTFIVIAHNLETILKADKFIFVDHGDVVVTQSLEELRRKVPRFEAVANLKGW